MPSPTAAAHSAHCGSINASARGLVDLRRTSFSAPPSGARNARGVSRPHGGRRWTTSARRGAPIVASRSLPSAIPGNIARPSVGSVHGVSARRKMAHVGAAEETRRRTRTQKTPGSDVSLVETQKKGTLGHDHLRSQRGQPRVRSARLFRLHRLAPPTPAPLSPARPLPASHPVSISGCRDSEHQPKDLTTKVVVD